MVWIRHFGDSLKGRTIGLWGLAFKPNTDDMREAPSRVFLEACWEAGVVVRAFDPVATNETRRIYGDRPDLILCDNAEDALEGADALVVATEWREFRSPDFGHMAELLSELVIIDGRNIFQAREGTSRFPIWIFSSPPLIVSQTVFPGSRSRRS